jgi:hypothetical protein
LAVRAAGETVGDESVGALTLLPRSDDAIGTRTACVALPVLATSAAALIAATAISAISARRIGAPDRARGDARRRAS